VASFREAVGTDTDDPRSIELVGELSLASPLFRTLWARPTYGRAAAPRRCRSSTRSSAGSG
jgi:hypothetical protein